MPDPQRLKLVEIFRSFLTNRKFSVNNKTYTLVLAPLFMLPSATMSYAQASDVTSPEDKSSILIIKQRSGLSELDTPAVVSIVESDALRRSREPVNLSENLGYVSSVHLQHRQNYAQDLQLSVRSFSSL